MKRISDIVYKIQDTGSRKHNGNAPPGTVLQLIDEEDVDTPEASQCPLE